VRVVYDPNDFVEEEAAADNQAKQVLIAVQ
jgi:hypothetical protein